MEDTEGVLSFDFEGGLDSGPAPVNPTPTLTQPEAHPSLAPSPVPTSIPPNGTPTTTNNNNNSYNYNSNHSGDAGGRRSFRQTVCRHWLRSLCMKGDACGFLHQYDKARMPVCRFFRLYGECREQDCVYKHTNEDIKECNMYKLGFCPNGPDCRYRHAKLPGPPPPVEEVLQKIQQLTSYYGGPNKYFQPRGSNFAQHVEKTQFPQGSNGIHQGVAGKPPVSEPASVQPQPQPQQQQQQQQGPQSQQQVGQSQIQDIPNGLPNQGSRTATPLPQGLSRCVQSPETFKRVM